MDILRGLSVAIMMIVDAVPDFDAAPALFLHSPWEGITIADLAFPGFVFAMGASAAFSLERDPRKNPVRKILLRTLLLFLLGLLFNIIPGIFSWLLIKDYTSAMFYDQMIVHGRLFGILQRLALTYAFGMLLALRLKKPLRLALAALLLLSVSSLGYHLFSPEAPFDKMRNLSQSIDLLFPGAAHVGQFYGFPFDPEGLYGTIASAASMLFGLLAGRMLLAGGSLRKKAFLPAVGGAFLLLSGWLWNSIDSISKPLWTAPYALLNAGGDLLVLALLSWLLTVAPKTEGALRPFYAFGRNPLFFFLISNFSLIFLSTLPLSEHTPAYLWLWQHFAAGSANPALCAVLWCLLWCLLWYPLAEFFCRRNIIMKL